MIIVLILVVIACFTTLEILSFRLADRAVHTRVEADMTLCAPEEEVTLRYSVTNSTFLPLLYVGISLHFDEDITVCPPQGAKERWTLRRNFTGIHVNHRMHLMPFRRCSGQIRLRIRRRGMYTLGQHYIEVGDYLGLRSSVRTVEGDHRIICTAKEWEEEPNTDPLGGLLGDISVLRFIHEDPCLLMGYREYTGREPMKQISWVQTAKTGELTVKVQDHTAQANVAVLVDLEGSDRAALERCLSLTRSVCEELEGNNIPYLFRSNGDLWEVSEGVGRPHLFPILRALGLSRLACFTPFADLADRCIREGRADRTYIVIAPRAPEAVLQKLQAYSEHRIISFYGKEEIGA